MNENAADILIVEDNPFDLELALRAIKAHNVCNNICVARDGDEALDFIFGEGRFEGRPIEQQPSMVLLDLKLPLIDGFEVLRRVRGDPRTRRIPVVIMTASNHQRDVRESYELGVSGYIVKPVDSKKFADAMTAIGA